MSLNFLLFNPMIGAGLMAFFKNKLICCNAAAFCVRKLNLQYLCCQKKKTNLTGAFFQFNFLFHDVENKTSQTIT